MLAQPNLRSQSVLDYLAGLVEQFRHVVKGRHVTWQATERVLNGRQIPNENKLFSIFEEHTELLRRGKAGKDVEFGHMIQIQQTGDDDLIAREVVVSVL